MAEDLEGGWVKLWRKIKKSRVWLNDSDLKTWIWCMIEARRTPDVVYGVDLVAGEFLTSYRRGAEECKQPQTTFYRAMKRLEGYGMIKTRVEHQFTVVTVCNFSSYQARKDDGGTKVERERNASGTEAERERNDNKRIRGEEGKKVSPCSPPGDETNGKPRKRFTPPTVAEVAAYCQQRGNSVDPQAFVDHYQANGWMRGKAKVKDWRACVRTWEAKAKAGGNGLDLVGLVKRGE